MRRAGSTLALVVLAAGLGAYLYFIDAKKPVKEDLAAKPKVFSLDAEKIEQIELKPASGDATVLKKDASGTWNILKPVQAVADQHNASDVATSLASLEQDRLVDENATDLKGYGLAEPRVDVTFNVAGESAPRHLLVGDKTPTNMGIYAKLPGDKRVFLIAQALDPSFTRTTFDLRDKTALKFDSTKVDSLELVSRKQTIRLVKSGDEWKMVKPIEAPADLTSVEGLIGQLQSAQIMSLKESPGDLKNLKPYGLDPPEVTATLGMGASNVVMELGGKDDDVTLWARDPSKPMVFSVGNGVAEELRKTPFELRRKELFEFRPFNTTRFEITRGKETRAFERTKGTDPNKFDTWTQVSPTKKVVDASNFEGALLEFSNLRAEGAVDKAGPTTGLPTPAAVITVKFEDGKKEERVTFGRVGEDVFAARPDQPGALRVEKGKFDADLQKLDAIK